MTRTQSLDTKDGFKFFVGDGSWLLVRTSGTEPLVRVMAEAETEDEARAHVDSIVDVVRAELG